MGVLDFKEIPKANVADGRQDRFELFARDFLGYRGFTIVEDPSRGADGGKDLIVSEARAGLTASTAVRWLVSCKHFAHTGTSVGIDDEMSISDRVRGKSCNGFMGFYSTLPSSGLAGRLVELRGEFETYWFDAEKIEAGLLSTPEGIRLAERYFPASVQKAGPIPAKLFSDPTRIECDACGRNLLSTNKEDAIVVLWENSFDEQQSRGRTEIVEVYFCCKGSCDRQLQREVEARHAARRLHSSWGDIPDLFIPTIYLYRIMAFINGLRSGVAYEPAAFDKMKDLFIATFTHVCRHPGVKDEERFEHLSRIPAWLGGMG